MSRIYLYGLQLALVLVVGLMLWPDAWAEPAEPALSPVVYPPRVKTIQFSHEAHVATQSSPCELCHEGVWASRSALDNLLPREKACLRCHKIERSEQAGKSMGDASGACALCHLGFNAQTGRVPRGRASLPNLKFSHKAHLDRQTPCATCHTGAKATNASSSHVASMPTMRTCLTCHDSQKASDACSGCHISNAGGVVKTRFPGVGTLVPGGSLRGAAHVGDFLASHKFAAQNDVAFCASCHKKEFCVDCHSGATKPMLIHRGDYVASHGVDARRNSPDCSSCHRIQSFCQGCHSRLGLGADGKAEQGAFSSEFHPPGWVSAGLLPSATSHALEAQRNIKQCASCHRETFCTRCHSAQPANALRISPHPKNWRASRRCQALLKRNKRMCLRCHTETRVLSCF